MIVVIADDLTGAAELAGVALTLGVTAEVQTNFVGGSTADVVCVDTDTRLLPPEAAAARVGGVARRVAAARPAWVFKKCDSVLRGSVLAEGRATAAALGLCRLAVAPANPSRGRVIRGGRYFIDGRPLEQTLFGRDPAHPRASSQVAELLAGDLAGVELPDMETLADVANLAASMPGDVLPVGAADLFAALLRLRVVARSDIAPPIPLTPTGATLAVCGSAASWARRRDEAEGRDIPCFVHPYNLQPAVGALRAGRSVLLGIGECSGIASDVLTAKLAAAVAALLRGETGINRVLLEGGATARAVVNELGWTRLPACRISADGVGAFRPAGASGLLLCIKPGSYAWPAALWPPPV